MDVSITVCELPEDLTHDLVVSASLGQTLQQRNRKPEPQGHYRGIHWCSVPLSFKVSQAHLVCPPLLVACVISSFSFPCSQMGFTSVVLVT